jgi:hypothetical protein
LTCIEVVTAKKGMKLRKSQLEKRKAADSFESTASNLVAGTGFEPVTFGL